MKKSILATWKFKLLDELSLIRVGILALFVGFYFCSAEISGPSSPNTLPSKGLKRLPYKERTFYLQRNWHSRTVIFKISSKFDETEQRKIFDAMDEISSKTCIKFQQSWRTKSLPHYLFIDKNNGLGCSTETTQISGRQGMTLDPSWCLKHGRILHELLHSLGFSHEHQRPDRDEFIDIIWSNILDDQKDQFVKQGYDMELTMGFPYDLTSIMHYANWSNHAAKDPKKPIILPKVYEPNMGQREGLDPLDIEKINWLYECEPHLKKL